MTSNRPNSGYTRTGNGIILEWRKQRQMTLDDGFNLSTFTFTPHERTVCNTE